MPSQLLSPGSHPTWATLVIEATVSTYFVWSDLDHHGLEWMGKSWSW